MHATRDRAAQRAAATRVPGTRCQSLTNTDFFQNATISSSRVGAVPYNLLTMSKDLIDSHVSLKQCTKAVTVLHSHETKKNDAYEQDQLLPAKEQHIWLNVTVKTIPSGHKLKPVKMYADVKSRNFAVSDKNHFQPNCAPSRRSPNDASVFDHQGPPTRIQRSS